MAEVVCSECGKVHDTLVCENCFKDLKLSYASLEADYNTAIDDLRTAERRIEELESRIKECAECKSCEAIHKIGGDIIEPKG